MKTRACAVIWNSPGWERAADTDRTAETLRDPFGTCDHVGGDDHGVGESITLRRPGRESEGLIVVLKPT